MRAAALLVLGGCGFDGAAAIVDATAFDAAPDAPIAIDDASPDAALPAFGEPMLVEALSSGAGDDDPTLTNDLLTIYFASSRAGGQGSQDIWRATRASADAPWTNLTPMTALNTEGVESNVDVSGDGRTITFMSDRSSVQEMYVSTLNDDGIWSSPSSIPGLRPSSPSTREYGAQLLGAGPTFGFEILFCQQGITADEKLYVAQRGNLGAPFATIGPISSVDDPTLDECDGWRVGRTLYFTRDDGAASTRQIYSAELVVGSAFEFVDVQLVDVNGTGADDDSDPWVSPDQRTLFFASRRADPNREIESIYMSVR